MSLASRLDILADRLEKAGRVVEAYQIDVVANTLDKIVPTVNSTLAESLGAAPPPKEPAYRKDFNQAIREYGVTDDYQQSGYILPDGNLLKCKALNVGRGIDPLADKGAIRIDHDGQGIKFGIGAKPTTEQINRIEYLTEMSGGTITIGNKTFEKGTKPREVTHHLKQTFGGVS